jgi:ATP-dependent RNA helicase DDX19/DBP5
MQSELLSGELNASERASVIKRFRENKIRHLVTTNVAAHGIDVPNIKLVANFEVPVKQDGSLDYTVYMHRIGRTGRFGRTGVAINFLDTLEAEKHLNWHRHLTPPIQIKFEVINQ